MVYYNKVGCLNPTLFTLGDEKMLINTETMFSMTQANQNFSTVARTVDRAGEAMILRNNKPKYLVVDVENDNYIFDLSEDERVEIIGKRVLNKYINAFKELGR